MRVLTAVLVLLAPSALAADPGPAVVLLVRADGWTHAMDVAVDGRPAHDVDAAVRERLAAAAPVRLDVARNASAVVVRATSSVDATVQVHVVEVFDAVARNASAADLRLVAGRAVEATFPAPDGRVVVWVSVADDPSGRFASGEVLQAALLEGDAVTQVARAVLLEAHRCPACGDAEAAARRAASAYAAGLPERDGYARAPTTRETLIGVASIALAAAVLVPWRRT